MTSAEMRHFSPGFLTDLEAVQLEKVVRTAVMSIVRVFGEVNENRCRRYQVKLSEAEREKAALRFQLQEAEQQLQSLRQNDQISAELSFSPTFSHDFSKHVDSGPQEPASRTVSENADVSLKEEPPNEDEFSIKVEAADVNCSVVCDYPVTEHVDINQRPLFVQLCDASNSCTSSVQLDPASGPLQRRRLSNIERVRRYREKIRADPVKYHALKEKDRLRRKSIHELPEAMKKQKRKAWREATRRHRARKQAYTLHPHTQLSTTDHLSLM